VPLGGAQSYSTCLSVDEGESWVEFDSEDTTVVVKGMLHCGPSEDRRPLVGAPECRLELEQAPCLYGI
jgi:hypothetical protein